MQSKNQTFFYWVAAAFFAFTAIMYIRESYWLKMVSSICMTMAFVLLAFNSRLHMSGIRWATWLLLAVALSIQLLHLVNRFGFDNELF